ncbi:hypothetical protein Bpfe_014859 [Biomphalaria pfeifferi]|uniref:Chitin-binding type-4 domain-containing protein n=1 Tax=Biomphalaria pfeifferi TaxID=112525 RepID=A0AAD8BKL8_BIOPF|nr:hypothetical protein Bpfe_014859 [Biomphalaria pfeifferi]
MLEPPSRASLWRYGYNTPTNLYDDKTNCGGYDVHYNLNNGNCGVCGDPTNQAKPRDHEAGGQFSPSPTPVRVYKKGGYITVVMETTGTLFGRFEANSMETPEQSCFDKNLLTILESEQGTGYIVGSKQGIHTLNIQLPNSLTCPHCILQWRHVTGFMTSQDTCYKCSNGEQRCHVCLGCGKQVWYTGCTDVAIYDYPLESAPSVATTKAPSSECPPCASIDSQNYVINSLKPYTFHLYTQSNDPSTTPSPAPSPTTRRLVKGVFRPVLTSSKPASTTSTQQNTSSIKPTSEIDVGKKQVLTSTTATLMVTSPILHCCALSTSPIPLSKPTITLPKPTSPMPDKRKESMLCYVTNRKRHPTLNIDLWCSQRCPSLGRSVCLFKLCAPISCKTLRDKSTATTLGTTTKTTTTPTTTTTTTTTTSTTTTKTTTTTVKPQITPNANIFQINPYDGSIYMQRDTSYNWNSMNLLPFILGGFEF